MQRPRNPIKVVHSLVGEGINTYIWTTYSALFGFFVETSVDGDDTKHCCLFQNRDGKMYCDGWHGRSCSLLSCLGGLPSLLCQ
jgi:hypothetical protein